MEKDLPQAYHAHRAAHINLLLYDKSKPSDIRCEITISVYDDRRNFTAIKQCHSIYVMHIFSTGAALHVQ